MREFDGLLKSEVRKAEKLANKVTGSTDCKLTGYSYSLDVLHKDWVQVLCEICHGYDGPRADDDVAITIGVCMRDRRRSYALDMTHEAAEYVMSLGRGI